MQHTSLNVVATTARKAASAKEAILADLDGGTDGAQDRLTTLDMDITDEAAIEKAAKAVESQFGKGQLRLMINVAGIVSLQQCAAIATLTLLVTQLKPEKALTKLNYDDMLTSFKVSLPIVDLVGLSRIRRSIHSDTRLQ